MIENPDGTKRVPTKEELLEYVRRRSENSQSNGNGSESVWRPTESTNGTNRPIDNERPGETQHSPRTIEYNQARVGTNASSQGSEYRSTGGTTQRSRQAGGNDGSADEHFIRTSTDSRPESAGTGQQSIYIQPEVGRKRKSKFTPYVDAIRTSFNEKKKEEKPKRTYKVLSKEESINLREKIIDVILWQSEHTDEFIRATTRGHQPVVIWSDLDKKEAAIIADYLIERGKTNARAAHIVRSLSLIRDRIQLLLITVPRAYRTIATYLERGISIR